MNSPNEKKTYNRLSGFWAIVRYEFLWNIRKKKVLGLVVVALALGIIQLALTPALYGVIGQSLTQDPNYVVSSGGIGGIVLFLFALVTVMNSISGEFESGTIVPLLTKPVSRTTIFLGKLSAAVITLLPVYVLLFALDAIGGTLVYGPQNNLLLLPLSFIGTIVSTLVWLTIVLAIGSITKSSLMAALGGFLIYVALYISSGILTAFSGQSWILTYLPGSGTAGYIQGTTSSTPSAPGISVSTGTDNIGSTLVNFILHPSSTVAFYKISESISGQTATPTYTVLYTEPILNVLLTAVGIAVIYIAVFSLISWFSFKRAQVAE